MRKRERRKFEKRRQRERKIRKLQNLQKRNNQPQSYFSTQAERVYRQRLRQLVAATQKRERRE